MVSLIVAVMALSTAFAGTQSAPDVTDDTGDWQADPDPGVVSGNASSVVSDSIDITGVWFDFTSKDNLQVGVNVVNLADQDTNNQDTGSLTYSFQFTFHRPALPGAEATNQSGLTATINTNLNPGHAPTCDGGDNASKFPSEDYLICDIPASNVAPSYEENTTFYDGDQITAGSLDTEGQTDDGVVTYSDSASGMDSPATAQDVQPQPTADDGGGGDDGGGDDGGDGGGDGDGGGNGESTPGVGVLGAIGAMAVVAALAARRRD